MAKLFKAECCSCGHKFSQKRSISQIAGINEDGSCFCPKCGEYLQTTFIPKEQRFETKKFRDYMKGQIAVNQ